MAQKYSLWQIRKIVEEKFPESRMRKLYNLFDEWRKIAYQHWESGLGEHSVGALKGKLYEEYYEAQTEMRKYLRSGEMEDRNRALEESADVINMAQIAMPYFADQMHPPDSLPDLEMMIISIAYHNPRYNMRPVFPYDIAKTYTRRQLFSRWIKEVDSITERHRRNIPDDKDFVEETIERVAENIQLIQHDIEVLSKQKYYPDMKHVNVKVKGIRLLNDVITNMVFHVGVLKDMPYEGLFAKGAEKMKKREERYGMKRNDEIKAMKNTKRV